MRFIPPGPIFFFFNDTATTEIYTLSLHDALPISGGFFNVRSVPSPVKFGGTGVVEKRVFVKPVKRSEEHTSELQSRPHLVCRLLLEKKKKTSLALSLYQACGMKEG